MATAQEYATDVATAMNEAAATLYELLAEGVEAEEGPGKDAAEIVFAKSNQAGEEAYHRQVVDGNHHGAIDGVNIARNFAMDSAADLLQAMVHETDPNVLGVLARAYTYYLAGASAAICFDIAYKRECVRTPDSTEGYLKFLEAELADWGTAGEEE